MSGNREFSYKANTNGSFTFYTKGVDRYFFPLPRTGENSLLAFITEKIAFAGADALWDSFQDRILDYVESHGGQAMKGEAIKKRPKTQFAFKELFKSNTEITTSILCGN